MYVRVYDAIKIKYVRRDSEQIIRLPFLNPKESAYIKLVGNVFSVDNKNKYAFSVKMGCLENLYSWIFETKFGREYKNFSLFPVD